MPDGKEDDNNSTTLLKNSNDNTTTDSNRVKNSISSSTHPLQNTLWIVFQCVGITYIILPIIFLIFGGPILRELTYLNHLFQKTCDAHDYYPSVGVINLDIDSSQNYKIPAWYFQGDLDKPVFIYSHGNAHSRCGGYRLEGYNSLISRGYSFIAYDYGGFSNSTKSDVLTDDSLLQDLADVVSFVEMKYLKNTGQKLVLWGHSLGTGVTAAAVLKFPKVRSRANVIVLDSPFSSFREMVTREHFLSRPFKAMYGSMWDNLITYEMEIHKVGTSLETRDNLLQLKVEETPPIIIAHSEDDFIIPFSQSESLVKVLKPKFGEKLTFFRIPGKLEVGHNNIMGKAASGIFDKIDDLLKEN